MEMVKDNLGIWEFGNWLSQVCSFTEQDRALRANSPELRSHPGRSRSANPLLRTLFCGVTL